MPLATQEAVDLLGHKASAKRRQGAKRLRSLADPTTASAVRAALEHEVRDPRTWQTQYQMIMALATTGGRADVPLLKDLAAQAREATMVNVALGDAIVRLDRDHEHDPTPVLWCLGQPVTLLDDGALRAVAMLRLRFAPDITEALLDRLDVESPHSGLRFWPAIAAAGWTGSRVEAFLQACASGPREDVAGAAKEALAGRHVKVNPL
jgi:hypothetical protein